MAVCPFPDFLLYLNMQKLKLSLLFIFLLFPLNLHASPKEYILQNGLKLIVIEDHKSPLATFQIWYRVGSKDDPEGKSGISHLLEHMMFKGTHRYEAGEFSKIIQRNGGSDNAHTTKDYTMYHQTLSSDRVRLSIELEADRMANLLLDPKEVLSERAVVAEERRMRYEDDPQNLLYEEVVATSFKIHSYRRPVIGWMSDIESIEREDLYRYYKTYYSPDNAFIVISGDVDAEDIFSMVKENFGSIPASSSYKKELVVEEPEQKGEKRVYLKKEAELPYILIAYHTPNFPSEDSFALDVLSTILGDGKSSRLYRSIVYDKRLALNSSAYYSGLYRNPFLFTIDATIVKERDVSEVERAIYEEIEKIKKEAPSEREVQKAKNQLEAFFIFAQDSNYSKALYTGLFEMLGDWRLMQRYIDGIKRVRPEDVQAAAIKYLTDDNKTVGILVPAKVVRDE